MDVSGFCNSEPRTYCINLSQCDYDELMKRKRSSGFGGFGKYDGSLLIHIVVSFTSKKRIEHSCDSLVIRDS